MLLWSGLVVRLLAARFGCRLDTVRCPWSPPRSGTRPARCAVRRLDPCAVRRLDWSPHAYIRMKISTMSTRTPITNHPSPGKLMSWVGPPRITLLLPRSYRVTGSTVSRYISNAGRSIYWSPARVCPVLPGRCQLEHGGRPASAASSCARSAPSARAASARVMRGAPVACASMRSSRDNCAYVA
jgi:hypothetical protein